MVSKKKSDILEEVLAAESEVAAEIDAKRSPTDKKLNVIAKKLLQLERDLAVPGTGTSSATRGQRILDAIAEEDF